MKKKRIVMDASSVFPFEGKNLAGIGRTTLELVRALEKIESLPFELVLFGQRLSRERFQRYGFSSLVRYLRLPRWACFNWLRNKLPVVELLTGANLLHITSNYAPVFKSQKTIVTIHDAMFLTYPEGHLHSTEKTDEILGLARTCRAIITCSENSKKDLVVHGGINADKILVIYWGYDQELFFKIKDTTVVQDFLKKWFHLEAPYFFCVSCDIGRKNSPAVVENYLKLIDKENSHDLVMVWPNPPQNIIDQVSTHSKGKNVHFLANISDEELRYLYNGATVLLFPSEYEGFGLPVLEAMACGTPVVTCNVSSLPEVGGKAAIYIEPGDHKALLRKMESFARGECNREKLSQKCMAQAKEFSWQKCARQTVQVYCDCLGISCEK